MKHLYTAFIFLLVSSLAGLAQAQPSDYTPELSRALFHTRLDKAQKDLLAMDGRPDSQFTGFDNAEMNQQLTYLLTTRIDQFQKKTELSSKLDHNKKVTYLRGITELLYAFSSEVRKRNATWKGFPACLSAFENGILLLEAEKPLYPILKPLAYDVARILAANFAFRDSKSIEGVAEELFLKFARTYPKQTLRRLSETPYYYFTDSIISASARVRPEELISYAQASGTALGMKIAANPDPLVRMIVSLAGDRSGQMYFPFLDKLSRNELTRSDIEKAVRDSAAYYKLLVQTQIDYAGRMAKGDTPVVTKGLQDMLHRKSMEIYVNTINGLHDSPANIRFRKIQQLTPEELYYLIVMNETEIYTSSYTYVYKRIFELLPSPISDSLLQRVNYDKYKKFITMSANYNTLNDFLGKMSKESASTIMTSFVNNLDKGRTEDDIEDAVDVANAFASITQKDIRSLILTQVSKNLEVAASTGNHKGMIIYRLEKVIMESSESEMDSTVAKVNISDSLGIPPVYEIANKQLRDSLGRIILQMYFYGDAGGKATFEHFLRLYSDRSRWAVKATPQWVQFTSIGTPVPFVLFANRALDEENDEDEKAQEALIAHMSSNGFEPGITVHRGHSYYLPYTIQKMLPTKVVVLGSCGAYHNLADVLKISPDAYIISSKQVGYGEINVALFTYLVDRLKMGLDVKWPTMMSEVSSRISAGKKEGYDDYVFPHQNLGSLFIKAYRIAQGDN